MFQGFVALEGNFRAHIITRDSSSSPSDAAALPTFRVYGPNGYLGLSGTGAFLDSGTITNVVNNGSGLCRVTDAAHGLTTGARITSSGVLGATGANGTFVVTVIDANTFDLQGSTFGGAYTSGGTWHLSGAYVLVIAATAANGFAAGESYTVIANFSVGGTQKAEAASFAVV